MKYFLVTVLSSFLFIIGFSCKGPTAPRDGGSLLTPGRRDYVWTIDTLDTPNDPLGKMWGSSPTDVWRTSDGSWDKSISHFDGEHWSSYGVTGIVAPFAVYGFSDKNIFIGSAGNGKIWKYNGNSWIQFAQLTKDGHSDIYFEDIWGNSENDFYAVGAYTDEKGYANNAVIAHFNNGKWDLPNTSELFGIAEKIYINFQDNKTYLQIIGGQNYTDSTTIYEYSNSVFIKLYSNLWTQGLQADISLINGEVYFILGNQIAIRENNQFKTILNVDDSNFYQRIWGRNSKDIFLLMTDGLAHYNGTDVKYLFNFTLGDVKPWTQIYGAALFEKDAFFLAYEPTTHLNLIYHGILK